MERLTSTETLEVSGVTYRQLDYWVRKGYFISDHPTATAERGSGNLRFFSYNDAFRLRVIKTLIDRGVAVDIATEVSNHIDTSIQGSWYVTVEDGETHLSAAEDNFQGDAAILICVSSIKKPFDKKLVEIQEQQPLTLFRETANVEN